MGIAVAAAVVMPALWAVAPASAQQQPSVLTARAVPYAGPAGSAFDVEWTITEPARACTVISLSWRYGEYEQPRTGQSGAITVTVPRDAEQGTHPISVWCYNAQSGTRFTVRGVVPTTTTPPVVTTTRPPVTTTRPPVVTRPPATTTDRPPRTTTITTTPTGPTTTTPRTTTPTATTTSPTTTDIPPTTTTGDPGGGDLTLDRPAIQPGEPLTANGKGCAPHAPVLLTSGGQTVGATTADAGGAFTAVVEFTRVEPGRHTITAECGITLTGSVDQLITSSTGGSSTALVVLVFFVLAGSALIRFA